MKYVLLSKDEEIIQAFQSPEAFLPSDELVVTQSKSEAILATPGADMIFVDLLATFDEPHRIAGYEDFHDQFEAAPGTSGIAVVLIAAPTDYDIDFMVGWPDFVFAQMPRPVTSKLFRRASTWI